MQKSDIKEVLQQKINEAKTFSDWQYINGIIRGLVMAEVITPTEALRFQEKLSKKITF